MRALVLGITIAALSLTSEVALADDNPAQPPPADQKQPPVATGDAQGGAQVDANGQAGAGGANGQAGGTTVIVVQGDGKKPDEPKEKPHYGARFRSGIQLEGGVLAIPAVSTNFGSIGLATQLGAQINDLVGVYDQPALDIVFGNAAGFYLTDCILVDFTFIDHVTVGVGPEVGALVAFVKDASGGTSAAAAANYGARIHFAGYPAVGRSASGPRRNAFQLGFDTSLLYGGFAAAGVTDVSVTASAGFQLHAQLTLGYAGI